MRRATTLAAVAVLVLGFATSVAAQQRPPRGFLEIGAAANVRTPATVAQDQRFTEFLETADVTSEVQVSRGVRTGARAGWWITRRVAVAGGVSVLRASGTVQGTYAFPSPFVFNAPVTATGSARARRTAVDASIDVIASLVDERGWQLTAGIGPDIARVRQPLLADVLIATYEFPFTAITLTPAAGESRGTAVGVHVTAALARHLGRHLDLTGTFDYRRAPVHLTTADGTTTVDAGGAAAGGGLRIRF